MTVFGYARVSTTDQDASYQVDEIKQAHPEAVIRHESKSGTSREGREVLALLLDMVSEGDKLVVWKLDRLARNMNDLCSIVHALEQKGASLEILDQRIDTATASGKAFLQMLGVFAEFETNLRAERQAAGIARAKREGRYSGRKPVSEDKVRKAMELIDAGVAKQEAASRAGIGVATLYRRLKQAEVQGA